MSSELNSFLIPKGRFRIYWDYIILAAVGWYGVSVPIAIALRLDTPQWSFILDVVLTVFFVVDIYVNFHTPFLKDGEQIRDLRAIRKRYLRRRFLIDLISTIPWELLATALFLHGSDAETLAILRIMRLTRMLRLALVPSVVADLRSHTEHALVETIRLGASQRVKVIMMLFWVVIGMNLLTCGWIMIHETANTDPLSIYIQAFYWLVVTVATVGYGDITPSTDASRVYAIVVMLVGIGMYGFIIGNISTTIANANSFENRRREKFAALAQFMRTFNIPLHLQGDIFSFYNHFLTERAALTSEILQELPPELQREINKYVNMVMLQHVPFFRNVGEACLADLVECLTTRICTPRELVLQAGERGEEMYFLSHGVVEVLTPEGHPLVKLRAGSFFGEVALLRDIERTATVRCITFCDLYVLSRTDFTRVIKSYPGISDQLSAVVCDRYDA
ncbi:MAG: ion transporter [Magnetococcales bacterium]|nr:ion transporter [Magnetococcales bacterium]MBF0322437.1 ion transporter [Magnetococcales bacterium]